MSQESGSCGKHGFVYVMGNLSMPNLFKVGSTERHPALRAAELSASSGVPAPFRVLTYFDVTDRWRAEEAAHKALAPHRVSQGGEFYRLSFLDLVLTLVDAVAKWRALTAAVPGQRPRCGAIVSDYQPVGHWDGYPNGPFEPGGTVFGATCTHCGASLESFACRRPRGEDLFWREAE